MEREEMRENDKFECFTLRVECFVYKEVNINKYSSCVTIKAKK